MDDVTRRLSFHRTEARAANIRSITGRLLEIEIVRRMAERNRIRIADAGPEYHRAGGAAETRFADGERFQPTETGEDTVKNRTDVIAMQLLDQHWRQAEEWIDVFSRLSSDQLMTMLQSNPANITLVRKACAMVAEQARANIRNREETP